LPLTLGAASATISADGKRHNQIAVKFVSLIRGGGGGGGVGLVSRSRRVGSGGGGRGAASSSRADGVASAGRVSQR